MTQSLKPKPTSETAEEVKVKMLRERQREADQSMAFEQQSVLPDERQTYEDNARIYNRLQPEEQGAIRRQAGERIREETADAYLQSGLNLSEDQREVFALRFRQERRRLEREIQERANKERERRVPQIIDQLKKEFGRLSVSPNAPKGTATPENSPSPATSMPSHAGTPEAPANGDGHPTPSPNQS